MKFKVIRSNKLKLYISKNFYLNLKLNDIVCEVYLKNNKKSKRVKFEIKFYIILI